MKCGRLLSLGTDSPMLLSVDQKREMVAGFCGSNGKFIASVFA